MKKDNAWNIRRFDDNSMSQLSSELAYIMVNCRIFQVYEGLCTKSQESKTACYACKIDEFCQVLTTPLIQLGAMWPSCLTAQRSSSDDTRA